MDPIERMNLKFSAGAVVVSLVVACGGGPSESHLDATVEARVQAVVEAIALSVPTMPAVPTVIPNAYSHIETSTAYAYTGSR